MASAEMLNVHGIRICIGMAQEMDEDIQKSKIQLNYVCCRPVQETKERERERKKEALGRQ